LIFIDHIQDKCHIDDIKNLKTSRLDSWS